MSSSLSRLAASAIMVAAALLAGLGLYGLSSAIQGTGRTGDPAADPCHGLSSDECRALIERSTAEFFSKLGPWILTIPTDVEYLRKLPQSEMAVFVPAPLEDLAAVASTAQVVVVGKSREVRFNEDLTTTVTFDVEDYLTGSGENTIEVVQSGGPLPDEDWSPTLGYSPGDQLLLPGDRALLFLARDPGAHVFGIVSTSGHFRFDDNGDLVPMPDNPFADSVRGLALDEFTAQIESVLDDVEQPASNTTP